MTRSPIHTTPMLVRAMAAHRCACRVTSALPVDGADLERESASAVIVAIAGPDPDDCLSVLARLRAAHPAQPVFVLAAQGSERLATAVFRAGVRDYFSGPCDVDAVARTVARAAHAYAARTAPAAGLARGGQPLLGNSVPMQSARALLERVAARDVDVLITGETGTGKELAARLVHAHSSRHAKPLVAINCAAIPEQLLESELFGHERGAFTGAVSRRVGRLQNADGGTVFLDEIGDLGLAAQAKVLRALESREISPLGGTRPVGVNIRVIAATNDDLERAVEEKRFRRDLYFRLNVARVQLPPLRERRSDVHLLFAYYIAEQNRQFGARIEGLSRETEAALAAYDWPGNVRELRNIVESACLHRNAGEIALVDLPDLLRARLEKAAAAPPADRDRLLDALTATHWNVTHAAARLQWSRMTVYRKMAKYRLSHRHTA